MKAKRGNVCWATGRRVYALHSTRGFLPLLGSCAQHVLLKAHFPRGLVSWIGPSSSGLDPLLTALRAQEPLPPARWKASEFLQYLGSKVSSCLSQFETLRMGGTTQFLDCSPSAHKGVGLVPSTTKNGCAYLESNHSEGGEKLNRKHYQPRRF